MKSLRAASHRAAGAAGRAWLCLALLVWLAPLGCPRGAQPQPQLQPAAPAPGRSPLPALLARYVNDEGRVDYAAWKAKPADVATLDEYAEELLATPPHAQPSRYATDAERLAYWLNLYNALALREIVGRWPLASLADVPGPQQGFGGYGRGLLYDTRFQVGGRAMSLLDIETTILRTQYRDARVHFALNCGARSCPVMPRAPFDAATLEERLDDATRDFVNRARNVTVDERGRTVTLSPLFGWYRDGFVAFMSQRSSNPVPGLLDFVIRYAHEPLAAQLVRARDERYAIAYSAYDWRVNQASVAVDAPESPPRPAAEPLAKTALPALALKRLDGSTWRSEEARGKVVLIDFWATWCRPCLLSFPHYAEMQVAYERQGFEVVAVAQDDVRAPVDAWAAVHRPAITIVLDLQHHAAAPPLSVATLPTVLLVDRNGKVRHRHTGYRQPDVSGLRDTIETLLAEPAPETE